MVKNQTSRLDPKSTSNVILSAQNVFRSQNYTKSTLERQFLETRNLTKFQRFLSKTQKLRFRQPRSDGSECF